MAVYTTIDNPELYFQTKKYAGNGTDDTAITFDGSENMQPDLIWEKRRDNGTGSAPIFDAVRGATKYVKSNSADAEGTASGVKSFDANGFTLGTAFNYTSTNHVAWCWKANGQGSANTAGSINTTYTSANTTSGVSIIKYTGNGIDESTIGHGLGIAPTFLIAKKTDGAESWYVGSSGLTSWDYKIYLDTSDAPSVNSPPVFGGTAPTTTLIKLGGGSYPEPTNASSKVYIMYAFADVQGFSKSGSYTGNGNADSTFIFLGFRPAFFLLKTSSAAGEDWRICDNKRDTENVMDRTLKPNTTAAEADADVMDFVSNGVKLRSTDGGVNYSGRTYIYLAFAEAPFVNSNGVPCNAR